MLNILKNPFLKFIVKNTFENEKLGKKEILQMKQRAKQDFQTLIQMSQDKNKIAIISIDMQEEYFEDIYPHSKIVALTIYHKEIEKLCSKNKVLFIPVEFKDDGAHLFKGSRNALKKTTDSVTKSTQIVKYLKDKNIALTYVIGINRNACVLSSIIDLKQHKFNVVTSFIGTGTTYSMGQKQYRDKLEVNNLKEEEYKLLFKKNNIKKISLKNETQLLLKNNIVILDYHNKNL